MRSADPPPSTTPGAITASATASDVDALLAGARLLQHAQPAATQALLRGKNLGLFCAVEDDIDAVLFRRAAAELGAGVSRIRPDASEPGVPPSVVLARTAHVLGRLYDAIECQGLGPALVRQLGRDAGVPVFNGLACVGHPTAALAAALDGRESHERKRLWILQAALLLALR